MKTLVLFLLAVAPASGLIFRDGPSPAANTETAPTGAYAGSGWEYQLRFVTSHGTMISPKHFITAAHLGTNQEEVLQASFFNGVEDRTFAIKGEPVRIGTSDLRIFEIWETFEGYAELYTGSDEGGKELVIHGRGIGRGDEIAGKGWKWAFGAQKSRWGRNEVKGSLLSGGYEYLYFSFDDVLNQDEVSGSSRDSGGGWFIEEGGTWKLAGVTFAVDGPYSEIPAPTSAEDFSGSFYSAGGLYLDDGSVDWLQIPETGSSNDPSEIEFYRQTHTYGSRISSHVGEIGAIVADALVWEGMTFEQRFDAWLGDHGASGAADADFDGDGLTNLEEYFGETDPASAADGESALLLGSLPNGDHEILVRESLDLEGRGLSATVETSSDLVSWGEATGLSEESDVRDPVEGVRVRTLSGGGEGPVFYRLKITL